MRKQNSVFKTAFTSEADKNLKNTDSFGYVELDKYACYVIADGIDDQVDGMSAKLAVDTIISAFTEAPSMRKGALRRYLRSANKALAAQLYFDTGRDDAMAALEQMYADQSEQQAQEDEKAQETAQAQTAAASVLAEGDAAFSKGDYEGARAFYTTALQKYTELEDQAQIDAINVKLAAVDSKLSVQAGLAAEAEGYMRQAESQYADKNYVQAKKYYLLAKDVYAELENDSKVSEVTRKLELIEMGISEEEQAAREAEEAAKAAEEAKQQAAGESTEPAPSETSQPEAVG